MPTYDYKCPVCGSEVQLIQKISEKIAPMCISDSCSNEKIEMQTIIAPSTFVLKGSGWARDGYSGGKKR